MSKLSTYTNVIGGAGWNEAAGQLEILFTKYVVGQTDTTIHIIPSNISTASLKCDWPADPDERVNLLKRGAADDIMWSESALKAVHDGLTERPTLPEGFSKKDVIPVYLKKIGEIKGDTAQVTYTINGVTGSGYFRTLRDILEFVLCRYSETFANYSIIFPKSILGPLGSSL